MNSEPNAHPGSGAKTSGRHSATEGHADGPEYAGAAAVHPESEVEFDTAAHESGPAVGEAPPVEEREFSHKDLKRAAKGIRKMDDGDLVDLAHKARQWDTHGGDMAKLKATADHHMDLARRAQADFDNYQKRAERMRRDDAKYANVPLMRDLLPSIDNLQRAIDAAHRTKDVEALTTGVVMTLSGLERALTDHGLVAIDAKGSPFDPELHEAVMTGTDDSLENGVVLDCFERGWKLHDRVIRPAKVRVNQKA